MLLTLLAAASLTVSPSFRPDDAGRHNVGITVSVTPTTLSPVSFGLAYEHARAETTAFGENAFSLLPRVQTLGGVIRLELTGRPYYKYEDYWYRERSNGRFNVALALRGGVRRFSYDIPGSLPVQHRQFIEGWGGYDAFVTPQIVSQFHFSRAIALEVSAGWEFGNSPREYRRLQSTFGISTQF